ncbi:MAG: hypothetical protein H6Q90_335 [Deltaproteobacteria bacterium]|nr:hypothetical protein [Deltaproteobacteria bacterium]
MVVVGALPLILSALTLVSCRHAARPPAQAHERQAVPTTAVDKPPPAAPPTHPPASEADAAADSADQFDVSHTEQDEVLGRDGIRVAVSWLTMTGTYHYATGLTITTPGGTLTLGNNPENGPDDIEPFPLVEKIVSAGPHRWVLLGWSSYGEGMQTTQAWLVDDQQGVPRVRDKLEWTTDRMHGGLALDIRKGTRIGIPIPQRGGRDPDDPSDDRLHGEVRWELATGSTKRNLREVERLPSDRIKVMALPGFFTPPDGGSPSTRGWAGRFVWFSAGAQFELQRR